MVVPQNPPWERLALMVAVGASVGSVYLSLGMGLSACPLCFYQRTFLFSTAAVLGLGRLFAPGFPAGSLSLLSLPLALSGLGVAAVHCTLTWTGVLVCPKGILGLETAPEQSLAAHVLLSALLLPGACAGSAATLRAAPRLALVTLVGAVLVLLSVQSSPKPPPFNPKYDAEGNRILISCERGGP